MTSPWLNNEPVPNPRTLGPRGLIDTWAENRNGLLAVMAADEMMRRLAAGQLRLVEDIEITDEEIER